MHGRALRSAAALDVIAVVIFIVLGRRTHDGGNSLADIAATATPFLVGLGAGWVAARAWRNPSRITTGLVIWPTTLFVGMLVRRWGFDDGTATSFVIVATLFLGATLVGWRLAATAIARRRPDATFGF